jgi:methyl-accepting chemotaxis protein PixJ
MITHLLKPDPSNYLKERNLLTSNSQSNDAGKTKIYWGKKIIQGWKQLSLPKKATILALALGVIPIASVGGIAYKLASKSLMHQIVADQESRTFDLRQKVALFTSRAVGDAQSIATSPLLIDPELREATSTEQKIQLLNSQIDAREEIYESIAVFDLDGNLLYQSKSPAPIDESENYSSRAYFQRAISTQAPVVNDPEIATESSKHNLEIATPIKEKDTGKIIGVVNLRMSLIHWEQIFQYIQLEGWEYRLIDSEGDVFAANESDQLGKSPDYDLEDFPQLRARLQNKRENNPNSNNLSSSLIMRDINDDEGVLVSLASIPAINGVPKPGWQIALSSPVDEAFAPLNNLRLILMLGTSVAALGVGAIAATLASRVTRPILMAAEAVQEIGQGKLNTQLKIQGQDELAMLGTNINKMSQQLKLLVEHQAAEAKRSELLKDLTLKLSRATSSEKVFQVGVQEILPALQADRVILYLLEPEGTGEIVAESLADGWASFSTTATNQNNPSSEKAWATYSKAISDYISEYLANNLMGQVKVIADLNQPNLEPNYLDQLKALGIKTDLVAPFAVGKEFQGALILHQCNRTRQWQTEEMSFFAQLTSQVVLALERTNLLKQQQDAQEQLQQQALNLLIEVEPISQGDLTTRATVTQGEIGTIADSYNSTVESLRRIVAQVQKSVSQIATTTGNNQDFARSLSTRAYQQSDAIAVAVNQIQALAELIQAIAVNTEQAETSFQQVLQTVKTGDEAMDRTVEGIEAIRTTVAETSKKVKRLGESSQKISKVVNLISSFADQTNLLALNASLEAARAGERGENFALVAEEVRVLAQKSAEATSEIEKLVASIQLDTREVVSAMEAGTERVVIGTKLVAETRQSLSQISTSSELVSSRIAKIAQETVEQSQASQKITQTIAEVSQMATTTSTEAAQLSASIQELVTVAEELRASADRFKI